MSDLTSDEVLRYCAIRLPHLRRKGEMLYGRCPLHPGARHLFVLEIATGDWHCCETAESLAMFDELDAQETLQ